ncbi:efflux RND transporter periplasmic adaptor subunit [Sphingomonas morindae]|uniref:Efflux RND transporter periplasmic adaptor subunit n=1 Tax=Sphingomonas morindae TaxID=1541170 RepID=A0ABY4XCV5_9SPHN|nr:efflux RND transporter periplasmic adaptor subunit [Sphingomonas morindae]USI74674.1 efflux RND transporter periplasmic adaptor subunit [Sphingomonas morindae]
MPTGFRAVPFACGGRIALPRTILGSAALVVTASVLAGCDAKVPMQPAAPPAFVVQGDRVVVPSGSPLRARLALAAVTDTDITQQIAAPAMVEADPAGQSRILAPLAGRIVRLGVRLGDPVQAGQVLAELASPDMASALADEARAQSQLRLTIAARDRAMGVKAIGGAADKDVQQAEADYAAAKAEAARAGTRLRQLGASAAARGDGLALTSPSSGVVTELAAAPGAFWTDPTASLMTVANIDTVWVTADVAETDLGAIRLGQAVGIAFAAYPGETIAGRVHSIAPLLDPETRRAKVRIALSNPAGRFKPGMFATVRFTAPTKTAPTVPTTALLLKDDATTVFVETRPWTFERRTVETGPDEAGRTTISHGLVAGQRVIAKGGVLLDD